MNAKGIFYSFNNQQGVVAVIVAVILVMLCSAQRASKCG
jgi:hypothetical protein